MLAGLTGAVDLLLVKSTDTEQITTTTATTASYAATLS